MIVVKITILIIIITAIFNFLINAYVRGNRKEAYRLNLDDSYTPWYILANAILMIMSIIGIILSVIYLLFLI